MKVDLNKIINQGNQKEMQKLFDDIFIRMQDVFSEENLPGITTFMLERTLHAFKGYVLETEYKYDYDLDDFANLLKSEVDTYINYLKENVKIKDVLYQKANMQLDEKCVYQLTDDFYTYDYDGNDNFGIMYHKGERVFICECGPGEGGYYALIASKNITINWGPAGMRDILPLLEKVDLDISKDEDAAMLLLILNGNMSIYDNKIRWNR